MSKVEFEPQEFREYIKERRDSIKGINEFRSFLIITSKDNPKLVSFKQAFQSLAESFIKYFSVNWVFTSKLEYKMEYLKCRHLILKRVRDPTLLSSGQI